MDGHHFDNLTRKLATGKSRRAVLKGLAGGIAGGLTFLTSNDARAGRPPRRRNGESCARATDCASFHCVDGVCCDTVCTGQCESCTSGACLPVTGAPVGDRPACPGSGACQTSCDGVTGSSCAAIPGPETSCGAPTCADGLLTTYACAGNGTCAATMERCGLAGCTADGTACASGCASDADCAGEAFCNAGVCQGDGPLGAPCAGDDQCQSGICAQGVCCASVCPGACQACNLPGNEGFCTTLADDESCAGGVCCDGACVDRQSDLEHCGACDNACPTPAHATSHCTAGVCEFSCVSGYELCGSACVAADGCCIDGVAIAAETINPANDCQACLPATSTTAWSDRSNGAACETGNRCTADTCQGGICTQGPDVVTPTCTALTPCHEVGTCVPDSGTCSNPAKATGAPCGAPASCENGVAHAADTCDENGACVSGADTDCGLYACDAGACFTQCWDDPAKCAAGAHCDRVFCIANQPAGWGCNENSDCISNICNFEDRICCNEACAPGVHCTAENYTCNMVCEGCEPWEACIAGACINVCEGACTCGSICVVNTDQSTVCVQKSAKANCHQPCDSPAQCSSGQVCSYGFMSDDFGFVPVDFACDFSSVCTDLTQVCTN